MAETFALDDAARAFEEVQASSGHRAAILLRLPRGTDRANFAGLVLGCIDANFCK